SASGAGVGRSGAGGYVPAAAGPPVRRLGPDRCVRSIDAVGTALNLAATEFGPGQLAFDALRRVEAETAGHPFDARLGQGLELAQARRQAVGIDAHCIQATQTAASLRPLVADFLAQRSVGVEQP